MKHIVCFFSQSIMALKIIKQQGTKNQNVLHYAYISLLVFINCCIYSGVSSLSSPFSSFNLRAWEFKAKAKLSYAVKCVVWVVVEHHAVKTLTLDRSKWWAVCCSCFTTRERTSCMHYREVRRGESVRSCVLVVVKRKAQYICCPNIFNPFTSDLKPLFHKDVCQTYHY